MRNKTRYERKRDKLQAIGLLLILTACVLADWLFTISPLSIGVAILAGLVLAGGYLTLRAGA